MTRLAVCFFGITRDLRRTLPAIEENILAPARAQGDVQVHAHLYRQDRIENPRSQENAEIDPEEGRLLPADSLTFEAPGACLGLRGFDEIARHGDSWDDGFRSLRNLIHQLHSLDCVTRTALAHGAEICLFCRPDLLYHDNLARPIARAVRCRAPLVQLPYWMPFDGLNDRFAICAGRRAIAAYGHRIEQARSFCETQGQPLHAEKLVAFSLAQAKVQVAVIPHRATRVRAGGHQVEEDFGFPLRQEIRRRYPRLAHRVRRIKRALGM